MQPWSNSCRGFIRSIRRYTSMAFGSVSERIAAWFTVVAAKGRQHMSFRPQVEGVEERSSVGVPSNLVGFVLTGAGAALAMEAFVVTMQYAGQHIGMAVDFGAYASNANAQALALPMNPTEVETEVLGIRPTTGQVLTSDADAAVTQTEAAMDVAVGEKAPDSAEPWVNPLAWGPFDLGETNSRGAGPASNGGGGGSSGDGGGSSFVHEAGNGGAGEPARVTEGESETWHALAAMIGQRGMDVPASIGTAANASNTNPATLAHLPTTPLSFSDMYGQVPLSFEVNQGQSDPDVQFMSRGAGYGLYLTNAGATLVLSQPRNSGQLDALWSDGDAPSLDVLRTQFVGANQDVQARGVGELPGRTNYLIGDNPDAWQTDIATFSKVQYTDLYEGIDAVYYGRQGMIEFDFVVSAGADLNQIQLSFEGADRIEVDDIGNLVLYVGDGVLTQHAPVSYQVVNGVQTTVASHYILEGNRVSFAVEDYDPTYELVIDPTLAYSTLAGGNNWDSALGVAVDSAGSAYLTGYTLSSTYPTTPGTHQGTIGGSYDAFVTKLSPDGAAAVYSTFIGGSALDVGYAIAVDSSGNAYVSGGTQSTNFAASPGAYKTSNQGGRDAFVFVLGASGNSRVWASYVGGSSSDQANGIAVSANGVATISGSTMSSNLPAVRAMQSTRSGISDAFVVRFVSDGSNVTYSSYYGGSSGDSATDVAIDSSGNAYIVGFTSSSDLSVPNAAQGTYGGGGDMFIAKVVDPGTSSPIELDFASYLGGTANDVAEGIAVDAFDRASIVGYSATYGSSVNDFPARNALQSFSGGDIDGSDAVVAHFTASGAVDFATFLGGSGDDFGRGVAVDADGNICIIGETYSNDLAPVAAVQSSNGGNEDAFFVKINAAGTAILTQSYLGGPNFDIGTAIAVDGNSNLYLAGYTYGSFPTTSGAAQPVYGGGLTDAFVAKISGLSPLAADDSAVTQKDVPVDIQVLFNDSGVGPIPLAITIVSGPSHGVALINNNGTPSDTGDDYIAYTPDAGYSGPDSLTYRATQGSQTSNIATVSILVNGDPVALSDAATTNEGVPVTINVLANDSDPDGDTLRIVGVNQPSSGLATVTSDSRINFIPEPGITGTVTFSYSVADGNGGQSLANVTVEVERDFVDLDGADPSSTPSWLSEAEEDDPGILVTTADSQPQAHLLARHTGNSLLTRRITWDPQYLNVTGYSQSEPGVILLNEAAGDVELTVVANQPLAVTGSLVLMQAFNQANQLVAQDDVKATDLKVILDLIGPDKKNLPKDVLTKVGGVRIHINDNFDEGIKGKVMGQDGLISDNLPDPADGKHKLAPDTDPDLVAGTITIGAKGQKGQLAWNFNDRVKVWWKPGENWEAVGNIYDTFEQTGVAIPIRIEGILPGQGDVVANFTILKDNKLVMANSKASFNVYTGLNISGETNPKAALASQIGLYAGYQNTFNDGGDVWRKGALLDDGKQITDVEKRARVYFDRIFQNDDYRKYKVDSPTVFVRAKPLLEPFDSYMASIIDPDDFLEVNRADINNGFRVGAGITFSVLTEQFRKQIYGDPFSKPPAKAPEFDEENGGAFGEGIKVQQDIIGWGKRKTVAKFPNAKIEYIDGVKKGVFEFTADGKATTITNVKITPP